MVKLYVVDEDVIEYKPMDLIRIKDLEKENEEFIGLILKKSSFEDKKKFINRSIEKYNTFEDRLYQRDLEIFYENQIFKTLVNNEILLISKEFILDLLKEI